MFKKIKQSRAVVGEILNKDNYFMLLIITGIILFIIFYILTLATTTDQSLSIFIMMNGLSYTISTFLLLGMIALLFSVYIILLTYKLRTRTKEGKLGHLFGSGGLITGLFSAGCPMCGAFLFGLFGAPLVLFFLPFKGLELRILAIFLLSISVYIISRSLIECKI